MTVLEATIKHISQPDEAAMAAARDRWNAVAKPIGGLGLLEDLLIRIAGVTRDADVQLATRELVVVCADNGVMRHGVSASDASVTRIMAGALGAGTSTACVMARRAGCAVTPVDVGMLAGPTLAGVIARPVRVGGTDDIAAGPAMSREECLRAVEVGIDLVRERAAQGVSLLLAGEMGIGNTTTACAVTCALFGQEPRELAGPGAGLSAEGVSHKVSVIESALAVNRPDPNDPIDVLRKVGGFDIAALCGMCLGAARYRVPLLLDGVITLAGAACAVRLCPECRFALFGSHLSAEPIAQLLLDEVGVDAPLHAGMHLGEGTGAVAMLPLLDVALEVYHNGTTFDQLAIDGYEPAG